MIMHNAPHPGEILRQWMADDLTVSALAAHLEISRVTLSKILNGSSGITAPMAFKLAHTVSSSSPNPSKASPGRRSLTRSARRRRCSSASPLWRATKALAIIPADFQLAGGPSVLFDTVFLALSDEGSVLLTKESAAVSFVADAFAQLKVIGATQGAEPLLKRAGVQTDEGVLPGGAVPAYIQKAAAGRIWSREPMVRTIY